VQRNYGFVVFTLDEREYILSAVTHGIRNNWINALKSAANLNSLPEPDNSSSTPTKLLKEAAPPPPTVDEDTTAAAADLKQLRRRSTADGIILTPSSSPAAGYLKNDAVGNSSSSLATRLRSESGGAASGGLASPPLTRTPTSRVKKERCSSAGRLSSGSRGGLKASTSDGAVSGQEKTTSLLIHEEIAETNMIPERDTGKLDKFSSYAKYLHRIRSQT
jgi:hypothetical protein